MGPAVRGPGPHRVAGGGVERETSDDSRRSQEAAPHPGGKGEPQECFKQGNDRAGVAFEKDPQALAQEMDPREGRIQETHEETCCNQAPDAPDFPVSSAFCSQGTVSP